MTFRKATDSDLPAMIELLKSSLGESLAPKSVELWNWKHVDNPFGTSPVLLAEEEGIIIGLRTFMCWNWKDCKGKTIKALRAVDTATHPAHQGKGIFKKLTLKMVEDCQKDGYHFIFNTPNDKSRPGYLKMGWKINSKIPIRIKMKRPIQAGFTKLGLISAGSQNTVNLDARITLFKDSLSELSERIDATTHNSNKIETLKGFDFYKWRYADCPILNYYSIIDENLMLIFHLKQHGALSELRIVESIPLKYKKSEPKNGLNYLLKTINPTFSSVSPILKSTIRKKVNANLFLPALKLGPILTTRSLNFPEIDHYEINDIAFSLGDFELF